MSDDHDRADGTPFKDHFLAMRYLRELRERGELSPELQAVVNARGRDHIELLAWILERLEGIRDRGQR